MIVFATTCLILCLSIAGICVGIILVGEIREASHQRYLDALERAQEEADYMYATGMTEAEMRAEQRQIDRWQKQGGMDFNADEKGYS